MMNAERIPPASWTGLKPYATYPARRREELTDPKAKAERADDDAIIDDVAGKAFVEQFGLEVFENAEKAVRVNKASRYDCGLAGRFVEAFLPRSVKPQTHIWLAPLFWSFCRYGRHSTATSQPRLSTPSIMRPASSKPSKPERIRMLRIQVPRQRRSKKLSEALIWQV